MLVRAARRKAPRAIRQQILSEQLYLPFLCPAIQRGSCRPFSNDAGSPGLGLRKRRNSRDSSLAPRRTLATAVDFNPHDTIPFEGLANPIPGYGEVNLTQLRHFEPSSALVLGGSLITAPVRHRQQGGISGSISEMAAVLDACLHVGKIDRAAVIMKRIIKLSTDDSAFVLDLHNRYLKASIEQLRGNPQNEACLAIHKWFEMEMRSKGVAPDEETLAYMMKASLYTIDPKRRERLVRKYIDMADEGYQVLLHDILTPEEMNTICQICPEIQVSEEIEELHEYVVEPEYLASSPSLPKRTPEVMEVPQKGLGLKALKHTLSLFNQNPEGLDASTLSMEERRLLQQKIEADAVESSLERWRDESVNLKKIGMDTSLQTKSLGARMWRWQGLLEEQLRSELIKIDEAEAAEHKTTLDKDRCHYGPFLRYLPVEKVAAITIISMMTHLTRTGVDRGITLVLSIQAIADALEEECLYNKVKTLGGSKDRLQAIKKDRTSRYSLRKMVEELTKDAPESKRLAFRERIEIQWRQEWPSAVRAKLGAFLASALIDVAKVPVTMEHPDTKQLVTQLQPAFTHGQVYRQGKKIGVLNANIALVKQLKREPVHSLLAKHLPMLIEPEPWSAFNKGAFIVHPSKMMRIKQGDKEQRHYAEAAILKGDMVQTFKGLDVLGKTPWRINQPVFDVMLQAWNSGDQVANLAPANPSMDFPPEPEANEDPNVRRRWMANIKGIQNVKSGMHSQRCFQNFQLEIARSLRNETFYFPHNVDFRGRAYPIPPYLNHMGADHCRGLLMFGKGKELGEAGLKWLKIQLANVFGYDKASLQEREAFATEHLDDIRDSVSKPLNGKLWWLKAEDPWQCLAACFELKSALDLPDPTKFVSYLPVHQDGTCNGLQHYAALGGDEAGAKQVNLEPGERPGDVYSAVANLVKEHIADDIKKGNKYAQFLDGKITRKVVKQTVMTNVYGVTFVGAKDQVKKQLIAMDLSYPKDDEEINPSSLAIYIATKIFKSLSTMFRGAQDIQFWFGECANRISTSLTAEQMDRFEADLPQLEEQSRITSAVKMNDYLAETYAQFRTSVIWTTPLKMPVVQPYRVAKQRVIATNLQKLTLSDPHVSDPIHKRKQLQGFPPNFIHSLDATHMILSALQCDEMGISFAAVHDSFWTHACDINSMNSVLRDAFIRIHSEDVIGRLAAEFKARHKDSMYLAKVKAGTTLHKRLREYRAGVVPKKNRSFWQSTSTIAYKLAELKDERKRQRLLASSDPKEVEAGKAMVTPASIYDELAAEADLSPSEGLEDLALGDISKKSARAAEMPEDLADDLSSGLREDEVEHPIANQVEAYSASMTSPEGSEETGPSAKLTPWARLVEKSTKAKSPRSAASRDTWVWLPLTFPPVPQKGKFDVSRLMNSDYFFS
ncbi:hypothetical protein BP5796_05195 [Coleophoma crateriformis]|uniref:DNA-directed RNA polymerase n=1 Tax=Coleophoma crateriformis TaxID=565419 RepID=A0A3D8S2G7_9HELO|nr:hypothetical protein BP5796_05195 [Coleophoma crateriformis]